MFVIVSTVIILLVSCLVIEQHQIKRRELGRFSSAEYGSVEQNVENKLQRWLESLGRGSFGKVSYIEGEGKDEREAQKKLREAGLETFADRGRFAAIRILCLFSWPVISILAWSNFSTYYAVVTIVFSFAFVIVIPYLWLSKRRVGRQENVLRELPLVVDLTNVATSAGWDVSSALEKVIDALGAQFPKHPLIKELKKARLLASSGYTWGEALDRVSRKVSDDTVTRVTIALTQAIEQGGDRSEQLSGIAQDAQRSYYATLDKRLAAIPVKALIITMVLFLSYFTILLAPSAVGIQSGVNYL